MKNIKNIFKNKTGMEIFYCILFWLIFIITIALTAIYLYKEQPDIIKDFSLPLLALIFTIGQLWQNESKNRFEKEKYIQSRKDLYFDKKVEILIGFNKYIEQLSSEISKPFFKQELSFSHEKLLFTLIAFYRDVVTKAKLLFNEDFANTVYKITDIIELIQKEIQIMQNYLLLSEDYRNNPKFIEAEENYYKYYKELFLITEKFGIKISKELNIKENVNA